MKIKRKVFIVDNDPLFRAKLKYNIEELAGVEVYTFVSAEECLLVLDAEPEAIITDQYLDNPFKGTLSGLSLLRKVKETHPQIEVLILSPDVNLNRSMQHIDQGAFDSIEKTDESMERVNAMLQIIFRHNELSSNVNMYRNSMYFMAASCMALVLGFGGVMTV